MKKKLIFASIFLCILLSLSLYIYRLESRPAQVDLYFFNLERGKGIMLRTSNNRYVLLDGGQNIQIQREITKIMPFYRRKIDLMIFSREEAKNIGGLIEILDRYEVGKIIQPALLGTSTALDFLEKKIEEKGIEVIKVAKGDRFEFDDLTFEVLFPDLDFKYNKTSQRELVLKISYKSKRILLLGEVSKTIQKSFLSSVEKTEVVEYAHSGGETRTSFELIEKAEPDFLVIKRVGKNQTTKPIENRVRGNIKVLELSSTGTVHFVIDERGLFLK